MSVRQTYRKNGKVFLSIQKANLSKFDTSFLDHPVVYLEDPVSA